MLDFFLLAKISGEHYNNVKCTYTHLPIWLFKKAFWTLVKIMKAQTHWLPARGRLELGRLSNATTGGHRILPLDRPHYRSPIGAVLALRTVSSYHCTVKTRDSQWQLFPLTVRTRIPIVPHIRPSRLPHWEVYYSTFVPPPKGLLRLQILKGARQGGHPP